VQPLASEKEASLLKPLLEGLSTHFLLALDTCPDISRDLSCSTGILSTSPDLSAVFIGGSNADKLANAAASLGIVAETVTTSGWVLSTTAVTAILPEVEALCITLPADSPVIIYCLDNSAFVCADNEGAISPIKKLEDGFYHVVGELVVAHEVTLAAAVSNLKRLLEVCGGRTVIIISPFPRYLNGAREKIFADLTRLHSFISNRLSSFPNCKVIAAGDLLVNKAKAPTAEVEEAYNSAWGTVHGSNAAYTRMALSLTDSYLNRKPAPLPPPTASKRPRSDSSSSSGTPISVVSSFRPPPTRGAGHSRGGGNNFRGGSDRGFSRGGNRGNNYGRYHS